MNAHAGIYIHRMIEMAILASSYTGERSISLVMDMVPSVLALAVRILVIMGYEMDRWTLLDKYSFSLSMRTVAGK
jgi:hypothetical protein